MAEWLTMGSFYTNQVVRATDLQNIWYNIESLRNPEIAQQHMPGAAEDYFTSTSTAFLPVDSGGTYYSLKVQTYGGDLLLAATVRANHSLSLAQMNYQFAIDGDELGNTSGGMGFLLRLTSTPESNQIIYLAQGISAGSHSVDLLVKNVTGTGEARTYKTPCLEMCVMEFP
jgi:hypothetical protein